MKKKWYLYLTLIISIMVNLIFFKYDIFDPYLLPKINKRLHDQPLQTIDGDTDSIISMKALEMFKGNKIHMIWDEEKGLSKKIFSKKSLRENSDFQKYNFPKAFLMFGLVTYAVKNENNEFLLEISHEFENYIDKNGNPLFQLNKVDQVPFGLASLVLFTHTNDQKYLSFADHIFDFINTQLDENNMVVYRSHSKIYFYDTLGMIVPFLVKYFQVTGNEQAMILAKNQIKFYINNNGINKTNYMPFHGINKEFNVQVGSSNWGRGIGWYLIALAHFYKETGYFEKELMGLLDTLMLLKNSEGLWSQFPGSSDKFDASSTIMIMYTIKYLNPRTYPNEEVLKALKNYLLKDGTILQTSGDTYSTNVYSRLFGKSELTQGILLLTLSQSETD